LTLFFEGYFLLSSVVRKEEKDFSERVRVE
jgi:hypothetical protein